MKSEFALARSEVEASQAMENIGTSDQNRVPTARNEIAISGLLRKFGDITAVNNLNLNIRKGEMFGFLGPNGAGKTTTISMLCGLLKPTAGSAQIAGYDIAKEPQRVKALIGVCPQEAAVFKFLTGMENLILFGNLHGINAQLIKERVTGLVDQANFSEAARRKAKGYSGGMLRQLNLLIATVQGLIVLLVARLLGFEPLGGLAGLLLAALFLALLAIAAVGLGLITASVAKDSGAAGGLAVIFIVPMMMFGSLLAVFNGMTRNIARFMPNYYVSDSLSVIFHTGRISDPVVWQNLLILAGISLVIVVAGMQIFKRVVYQ